VLRYRVRYFLRRVRYFSGSSCEIVVCDLQIVLQSHVLAVADPGADHMARILMLQLCLPGGVEILKELRGF